MPSDGDDLTFAGEVAIMSYSSGNGRPPPRPNASIITRCRRYNRLYTLHELGSALSVQAMPTAPNGISSGISSSPPTLLLALFGPPQRSSSCCPLPASVGTFISNRNTSVQTSTEVSFAIFENVGQDTPEKLSLMTQVRTGLDQIRGMQFGGEDDEYLIAGGVTRTAGVMGGGI
ncbi:hypothetical protein DFH08DRAFT_970868 [Mycena albidolilacea]|uniref:Uncharacterized protein n=1 Tax=Mycena albidolilacea TaxID=1033008 RepID=A0AAD6ZEE8_9AGAR|nr:hypothetical protein DFH08DRAFT_970868 [Mycena albidolilacea]